jgi:hypothetical protein
MSPGLESRRTPALYDMGGEAVFRERLKFTGPAPVVAGRAPSCYCGTDTVAAHSWRTRPECHRNSDCYCSRVVTLVGCAKGPNALVIAVGERRAPGLAHAGDGGDSGSLQARRANSAGEPFSRRQRSRNCSRPGPVSRISCRLLIAPCMASHLPQPEERGGGAAATAWDGPQIVGLAGRADWHFWGLAGPRGSVLARPHVPAAMISGRVVRLFW